MRKKSILITGGTGSFGQAFVAEVIRQPPKPRRLVVFSRDELKQFEMAKKYPEKKYDFIRFFIGDVRDRSRLRRALEGIDTVVHAAALKQVPTAEYNPMEFIHTNVQTASIQNGFREINRQFREKFGDCSRVDVMFVQGSYRDWETLQTA